MYLLNAFSLQLVCTYEDEEGYDRDICKIVDRKGRERFFKCFYPECEVVEVKQVTKMVEQTFWEEV